MLNSPNSLIDLIVQLKEQGSSEKEIKKSYSTYLENLARKDCIPLHGKFELTPLCNLSCKMCYVHLDSFHFQGHSLIMPEVWKRLIDDAHKHGMLYATLTGGECLTYPYFDEIYLYLYNKGIVPCIMTNGLLLDEDRIRFFKDFPPRIIQATLYGSSDDAYEQVTGHRVFHTIYHNLELLRESKLRAHITITPNAYMRNDILQIMTTAESLKMPFAINASLITPRSNTGRELGDLEIEEYIKIYKIWKEQKQEDLIPIDNAEIPDESHEGKPLYGLQCGGGRSTFTIQFDGKMSPCPSMGELYTEPLCDGFVNAWHRLNDLVNNYPMPCECADCIYHNHCLQCPAIHNNAQAPGHCDPRICNRTKRLIQYGFMPAPNIERP